VLDFRSIKRPLLACLPRSSKGRNAVLVAIWLVIVGGLAGFLAQSQAKTREEINTRFGLRAEIASRFVSTYVEDLVSRQREVARRSLSGDVVSARGFERTVIDNGYEAAVLLDRRGRLLGVVPPKPELLGTDITPQYDHLMSAVQGHVAISKVVPSAARGIPVVAFAVPYLTSHGRRVYSGAYDVSKTPLASYVRNAVQIKPNRVYLLDPSGQVIAKNGQAPTQVRDIERLDPELALALETGREGSYDDADGDAQRYASRRVRGTPWRVAISVPESLVYTSISGGTRWLPWLAIAGLLLGGLLAIALLNGLLLSRERLASANTALDQLSRVDALTGLHNRRHLQEVMEGVMSAGTRHGIPLSVLLVDIDHFKAVNDNHGHQAGDDVLRSTANVIRAMTRTEDSVARWGGEEFLIALPGISIDGATAVAKRMRTNVSASQVEIGDDESVGVTVTIGVAQWNGESADELVKRADAALYAGKAAGRNRVERADSLDLASVAGAGPDVG
jgi:diguanylate cyclase (GGDEF)-like protein